MEHIQQKQRANLSQQPIHKLNTTQLWNKFEPKTKIKRHFISFNSVVAPSITVLILLAQTKI